MLLEFDEELRLIAVAESVNEFFHVIAFAVLEGGLDRMLASMGTFNLEDRPGLPRRRFRILPLSLASVLAVVAGFLRSLVPRHCCRRRHVVVAAEECFLGRETLVILINMSYSLWT